MQRSALSGPLKWWRGQFRFLTTASHCHVLLGAIRLHAYVPSSGVRFFQFFFNYFKLASAGTFRVIGRYAHYVHPFVGIQKEQQQYPVHQRLL